MTKNISIKFIALIAASLTLSIGIFAQSTVTGGINGRVTDRRERSFRMLL